MLSRRGGRTTDDLRARPALHEREIPPLLELNRRSLTPACFPISLRFVDGVTSMKTISHDCQSVARRLRVRLVNMQYLFTA